MRTFFLSIMVLFIFSCSKDDQNPNFPNKTVNLSIYPGSGAYYDLGSIGGWMYLGGGVNGILVYRRDQYTFIAYDRACPYKPKDACEQIEIESGNSFIAVDKCCGSKFLITTGDVTQGPSEYNLQFYKTSFNGNLLQIWN